MTALVDELAYAVLETRHLDGWERFAGGLLGFEIRREGAILHLRMDGRPFRYLLRAAGGDGLPILGWQVADDSTLEQVTQRVAALGVSVLPLGDGDLLERGARRGVRFQCQNGIDHEIVSGLASGGSFEPPGDVSGFVTEPGGLGHVVWSVPDVGAMDRLMIDAFGMALREDISTPAGPGHFYGCNARHHSLAVFGAPALKLEHLMVEMKELDDVGRAMDRAVEVDCPITQPLGRHRTDQMVSFYVQTPSGFGMEIGCHGVLCDDDWPAVRDKRRCRPWGHGDAMRKHHQKFTAGAAPEKSRVDA